VAQSNTKKRQNIAGDHAKERILDAAIFMFAERGYAATSTRDITTKAAVNQAAIYYHFGTKHKLFIAAIMRFFSEIENERYRLLDLAEAQPKIILDDVLRALIEPHIKFSTKRKGRQYVRMFNHFASTPAEIIREIYTIHFSAVQSRFLTAIHKCEPNLTEEALIRGYAFTSNNMVSSLFDVRYQVSAPGKVHKMNIAELVEMLVAYNAAGFRALK